MKGLLQDIRFGLRQLHKNLGFTAVAAFTLALGIGANTAIFSLVSGIVLRPLPYPRPAELVSVTGTYPKGAFAAMREQVHTKDVAAYAEGHEFNLTHAGDPVRLTGTAVSAELLSVLGVRAATGRTFLRGEDAPGADALVILSHDLWEQRFGGDPSIIGRSIELEGMSRQVVGVMPADFHFPSANTQLWVPLHNDPTNTSTYWAGDFMPVVGRLRPGSTMAQAGAEIRLFQSHAFSLFPWTMPQSWNADVTVVELKNGMVADVRTRLLLLLGAVALVLLIACANVANLMLSRAATREKEMGIRAALGAAPGRIARQVGKHVRFVGEKTWRTVVGMVADVRAYDLQNSEPDYMKGTAYVPYTPLATLEDGRLPAEMTIAVRSNSNSPETVNLLRSTLTAFSPDVPVSEIRTMSAVVSEAASTPASTTLLFATFAGVALVLGVVGIYGVLSFLVSRRRREMGVRLALGAQRSDVLLLIMKEGGTFALAGIALGLLGAFFLAKLLAAQLYGVSADDPITYISVSVTVAIVTLAACYVPARRAMQVDPMVALRNE